MRKVPHPLVIFWSGTRKKNLENGPFCRADAGARLFLVEKWLSDVLAPVLVHQPRSQKDGVSVRVVRKVLHPLVIFFERH